MEDTRSGAEMANGQGGDGDDRHNDNGISRVVKGAALRAEISG